MAVSSKFDITGKHAIVTGGAQGLSRGMAEGLLEAGCKVVLMDLQAEKLEQVCAEYRNKGYEAYGVAGNLGDRKDLDRMFNDAMEILEGRLDVLIPAAGIQRRYLPEEFPEEQWDAVINVNLNHVWFMIQHALKVMLKQPTGGKIITIGSMVTWFGGRSGLHRFQGRRQPADQERGGGLCWPRYQYQCHLPRLYGYRDVRQHDPGAQGRMHQAHSRRPLGHPGGSEGSCDFPGLFCFGLPERRYHPCGWRLPVQVS